VKTNIAKQRIVPVTPANVPKNNVATATRMLGKITGKFLVLPCNPILTYFIYSESLSILPLSES